MTIPRRSEPAGHDTLVRRLTQILVKLNRGERLEPHKLATEFGVDVRTVQRDLNQRFAYLDLIKVDGCYQMDASTLGKLSTADIDKFAAISGVKGLLPTLSHSFVRQLLTEGGDEAFLVRGHHYEDIAGFDRLVADVRSAVAQRCCIDFDFASPSHGAPKHFTDVRPYRLLNQKGIWYLAATDRSKLKTFGFSHIRNLKLTGNTFEHDPVITTRLDEDEGLWQSDQSTRVVISVASTVAHYFRRRSLIANQVVEQVAPDGSLLLSTNVGHPNEVVPIVRYWIPHLRIVEPSGWQQTFDAQLREYLQVGGG